MERLIKKHFGCSCLTFTNFSVTRGKDLVTRFEDHLKNLLPYGVHCPTIQWMDDADTRGHQACRISSMDCVVTLAKGSCVNWATTLIAYVHAVSHALLDKTPELFGIQERSAQSRSCGIHDSDWKTAVDWIKDALMYILDGAYKTCIEDCIWYLKRRPASAEVIMSAPVFLWQAALDYGRTNDPTFTEAFEESCATRRTEASKDEPRWRFQDAFDTIESTMQTNGFVNPGSVTEMALKLRVNHDPKCICCLQQAYNHEDAKTMVREFGNRILPISLPVTLSKTPKIKARASDDIYKSHYGDDDTLVININRTVTYADVLQVLLRGWATAYGKSRNDGETFNYGDFRRAVAGFAAMLIKKFPCDGVMRNTFPTRDCLFLALVPAPVWFDDMVPLPRLTKEGATKVLFERTFDCLEPDDLVYSMHSLDLENLASRILSFRLVSNTFYYSSDFQVTRNATVAEMTDGVIKKFTTDKKLPLDRSLYEVFFNDDLIHDSEIARDVFKFGNKIEIEPQMRRVCVLKGWSSERYNEVEIPTTFTGMQLLEKIGVSSVERAEILCDRTYVLEKNTRVDTDCELRVFSEGCILLLMNYKFTRNVENEDVQYYATENVFVDKKDMSSRLRKLLRSWKHVYGVDEAESFRIGNLTIPPSYSIADLLNQDIARGDRGGIPMERSLTRPVAVQNIPTHDISINDRCGRTLIVVRMPAHLKVGDAFRKICELLKIRRERLRLTTVDGLLVSSNLTIFQLFQNGSPFELSFTPKEITKPRVKKRLKLCKHDDHGPIEKRRTGKFAHPRPSIDHIVIDSDTEENDGDI